MKILLSAYACIPNRGSEPGVGWHWAIEVARLGHDVYVLTRAFKRENIEAELKRISPILRNIHFCYYEIPSCFGWKLWKKHFRGERLYYILWQLGAYRFAKHLHAQEIFDLVHHITFVTARYPSFMGNLDIPFIFGPISGGEQAPWRLRFGYGWRMWVYDILRDGLNLLIKIDPFMRSTFNKAKLIIAVSEQTKSLVPHRLRPKTKIMLAIGIDENISLEKAIAPSIDVDSMGEKEIKILFVGRFIDWKGLHLGFPAFALLLKKHPNVRLTMIGDGRDKKRWRKLAERLNIDNKIDWIQWVDHNKLSEHYTRHDLFLFPSLHESGGMVVLEAMSHGLPVLCLDLGGPGIIVDDSCGRVIKTDSSTKSEVIQELGDAMIELADNAKLRTSLNQGALRRYQKYLWPSVVKRVYSGIKI